MASTIENVRTEVLAKVHNVQTDIIDALAIDNQTPTVIPHVQMANAIVVNPNVTALVTQIANLTNMVQTLQNAGNNQGRGGRGGRGGQNRRMDRGDRGGRHTFGRHPRWNCTNIGHYCWSHGAYNHTGA